MIKTQLKRYYRWRFSGPITIIGIFAIGIILWNYSTSQIQFWDKFTCPQMISYYEDYHIRTGLPLYKDLPDDQKQKYSIEYRKCLEQGWSPNIGD